MGTPKHMPVHITMPDGEPPDPVTLAAEIERLLGGRAGGTRPRKRTLRERVGVKPDETITGLLIGSIIGDFLKWGIRAAAVLTVAEWGVIK
jgi:hypothetical protein